MGPRFACKMESWPSVLSGLRWVTPRWRRLATVQLGVWLLFSIGFVALIAPGFYVLVKFWFADTAVIFEPETRPFRRAWQLSGRAPFTIFLAILPFLLAGVLFTLDADSSALRRTPVLSLASEWSILFLLSPFPAVVTTLLYGWVRFDEDAAAATQLE